ncbi:potassium channel [Coprinopsis cinerea AmutBmut pab1-1]|nr:potassium channel [Coprinopsis cinerea AmutBmut pab1-1]
MAGRNELAVLALSVLASILLLLNFARRVPYRPGICATIALWYTSSLLLLVPVGLYRSTLIDKAVQIQSQSYYYGLIAGAIYATLGTLLVYHLVGSTNLSTFGWKARYEPSLGMLTVSQRTIMVQTTIFSLYLALVAGVYAALEGWNFLDAIYWADNTLLTIAYGIDFAPVTMAGKMMLIPFSLVGFVTLGLVINSVVGVLVERGRDKRRSRTLMKKREQWEKQFAKRAQKSKGKDGQEDKGCKGQCDKWLVDEFHLMRHIEESSSRTEEYSSIAAAIFAFVVVWIGGSLVFWRTEQSNIDWTYANAFYFSYTTITTVALGDYVPTSSAGKPFFVFWSLLAIPTVTTLISSIGDTIDSTVESITTGFWKRIVLPHPGHRIGRHRDKDTEEGPQDKEKEKGDDGFDHAQRDAEQQDSSDSHSVDSVERQHRLALKLAREIIRLVHDFTKNPSHDHRYSWEEWAEWIEILEGCELLEEEEESGHRQNGRNKRRSDSSSQSSSGSSSSQPSRKVPEEEEEARTWLWLSDTGPLFSGEPEPLWILEKLCTLLEESLRRRE